MTRSLYAILNVAPDADPAVIEAAYKALMKKYHPDVRADDPESSRRRAAEINEAFHTLRDPGKRAEYDVAERVRVETIRRNSVAHAEPPHPYVQPIPRSRRRSKWPALFMIAAAALAVFFIWRGSDAALGGEPSLPPILIGQRVSAGELAPVKKADVNRAVAEFTRIKERSGLIGLSAFSHDCFAAQSRSERTSEFDFCVAFDKAALTYGVSMPGHDYLPQLPRFEATEVKRRHALAGKLLSDEDGLIEARIAEVGILTSERLRALNPSPPPVADEPPVPIARAAGPAYRPRAERRHFAQRPHKRRSQAQQQRGAPDFLEREGYIY